MLKRVCLSIVVICLLGYSLTISAIPKDNNKIPSREKQIVSSIDSSLHQIIVEQYKLDELVTKLDRYTAYQGTKGKGNDWAASMVISYEFKQIGIRTLASVALIKQMLYLNEKAFPTYLKVNFDLIMGYFTKLTAYSLNVIEANYEYILDDELVKEGKEGVKRIERIQEHLVKVFSHFIER